MLPRIWINMGAIVEKLTYCSRFLCADCWDGDEIKDLFVYKIIIIIIIIIRFMRL